MESSDVHTARTQLSRLVERAAAGEEIRIAWNNGPVVRLVPVDMVHPRKQFGSMKAVVDLGPEFFEPLPQVELDAWET